MSAVGRELSKPGKFETHRTIAGAAVADNATISDVNFPPANAFFGNGCESIWVYWTCNGGAGADTIALQLLVRDGVNDVWVKGPTKVVVKDTLEKFDVHSASICFMRIDAETTTGTDVSIRVAKAQHETPQ